MGYLNSETSSKHGYFDQNQISRTFQCEPNVSIDILDRTKCPSMVHNVYPCIIFPPIVSTYWKWFITKPFLILLFRSNYLGWIHYISFINLWYKCHSLLCIVYASVFIGFACKPLDDRGIYWSLCMRIFSIVPHSHA